MKKTLIIILSLSFFIACKNEKKTDVEEIIEVTETPKVTLQMFNAGNITVNTLEIFSEGDLYKGQTKDFVDPTYIITHPSGKRLIWDTGLPESIGTEPVNTGAFTLSRKDSIANQLKALNLSYNDFNYIALSHIHFDHTGTANYFSNATWLVQQNEYEFTQKEENAAIAGAVSKLTKVKKLNGDYDVFGDGTVVIKSTPGHTIGHQSLYLNLGLERPILLTGDLYHFEENREDKIAPGFNYDIPQTKASMETFEAFAKEKNAEVIIQHSPKDYKKLQALLKQ